MADEDLLARFSPYLQYDSLRLPRRLCRGDGRALLRRRLEVELRERAPEERQGVRVCTAEGEIREEARPRIPREALRERPGGAGGRLLDAAGKRYVEDARRLHGDPRYADRTYGNVVRESTGATWLQYWFFYYYNDKNFFGVGLHEGDWEMIQLRLGRDEEPDAATFAQHREGQAFNWSNLELKSSPSGDVPVVYVGRGLHASFASARRALSDLPLPFPDYADGEGPLVRPALEVITSDTPKWVLWPGKWGSAARPDRAEPEGPVEETDGVSPEGRRRDARPRQEAPGGPSGCCRPAGSGRHLRAGQGPARCDLRIPEKLRSRAARRSESSSRSTRRRTTCPRQATPSPCGRLPASSRIRCASPTCLRSADRRVQRGRHPEQARRDGLPGCGLTWQPRPKSTSTRWWWGRGSAAP